MAVWGKIKFPGGASLLLKTDFGYNIINNRKQKKMKNKIFQAGRPVMGEKLIGREKILENIVRLLISGQSVVLIAPRRFGKTSLLIEALARIKNQGFFTANIDIFATPTKRILAEQITESVLKNRKLGKAFADLRKITQK